MNVAYPVRRVFDPTPAHVLAVCCCDGRYIKAVEEFLVGRSIPRHDLIAFPGGPAAMFLQSADIAHYMAVTHAFDFMVGLHGTRLAVLIAHADCAYYKKRYDVSDEVRQKNDLRRVGAGVRSKHPQMAVALFFARSTPNASDGFLFEEVDAESASTALLPHGKSGKDTRQAAH